MDLSGIHRRRVLATLGAVGAGSFAGCSDGGNGASGETPTDTATASPPGTETPTGTETPEDDAENAMPTGYDLYVATDGSVGAAGTSDDPLASIKAAIERVEAGDSIYVASGEYQESLRIGKNGTAAEPIEITGPPDAVLRRQSDRETVMLIGGDHVHLTGLSITGLADPARPNDAAAYGNAPLIMVSAQSFGSYNEGSVIAPHRIGDSGRQLVKFRFCKHAEAGPFQVAGRAGAKWQLTDEADHNGEIVYVGTARSTLQKVDTSPDWDRTRDVRIHHVDNSAGHPHSQLVDVKAGARDVTIEYCTDGGGSQNAEDWGVAALRLAGYDCTLRWCRILAGHADGVNVGTTISDASPDDDVADRVATENEIYGNEILGFDGHTGLGFYPGADAGQGPDAQAVFCGNVVEGFIDGEPESTCQAAVPEGDGVGHTGGDSPYS